MDSDYAKIFANHALFVGLVKSHILWLLFCNYDNEVNFGYSKRFYDNIFKIAAKRKESQVSKEEQRRRDFNVQINLASGRESSSKFEWRINYTLQMIDQ